MEKRDLKTIFEKNKDSIKELLLMASANFYKYMLFTLALQALLLFSFFIMKKSSLFLAILVFTPVIFVYIFVKDGFEDKFKTINFILVKLSVLAFLMNLVNHFFYSNVYLKLLEFNLNNDGGLPTNPNTAIGLASIFCFVTAISFFFALRSDNVANVMDILKEESILDLLGLDIFGMGFSEGDIILCKKSSNGRKVILPKKDRFLHMLVLGPTGSGKTSQIIIPMLNQDVPNLGCGVTVLEPKGDLAEKIYAMAQYYGRPAEYFNPILKGCPTFNPLFGRENDVIENMVTTFKMLNPDSPQFFQDMNEMMLRNALKVLKRLKGNSATLVDLETLITNTGGDGRKMVTAFSKLPAPTANLAKENMDIASYFLGEYYAERSKIYEHCSGARSQVSKIVSNEYLRRVLNPDDGSSDIDFDAHLENGTVICITTAQGNLRDLGRFLGYFIILNFQSAVFKRPGTEDTRLPHFLYIDEFQVYSNPGFADMLTMGRSYRVASHLATQNRALIGMGSGKDGEAFTELVSTNARNVIVFPGGNFKDAKYYSDEFGEILETKYQKGISRSKFNPLYGLQQMSYPNESIRESEEYVARFSPTDIRYKEFGYISYSIIQNNSLQIPDEGKIEYIPMEVNKKLDTMILENHAMMTLGYNPNEHRDFDNGGEIFDLDIDEIFERVEAMGDGEMLTMSQQKEANNYKDVGDDVQQFGTDKGVRTTNTEVFDVTSKAVVLDEDNPNPISSEVSDMTDDVEEWDDDF